MSEPIISLRQATVSYSPSVMGRRAVFERLRGRKPEGFTALHGIDLDIPRGESVGLLGTNGAGKSTLLKLVAGIIPPSSGTAIIRGEATPLLDLGAGIEGALDGWENIKLAAALQRIAPGRFDEFRDYVVSFSELGEALARPVRTYSSGMMLRLVFALRTFIDPEILVLDEIFGVGDVHFSSKAEARTRGLMRSASTLILASHDTRLLAEFCRIAVWLEKGRIVKVGPTEEIGAAYAEAARRA